MSEVSDLIVMQAMVERNSQNISMSPHFVEANLSKNGGLVTMGVSTEFFYKFVQNPDKFLVGIYFMDKEEFLEIKKELENENKDKPG